MRSTSLGRQRRFSRHRLENRGRRTTSRTRASRRLTTCHWPLVFRCRGQPMCVFFPCPSFSSFSGPQPVIDALHEAAVRHSTTRATATQAERVTPITACTVRVWTTSSPSVRTSTRVLSMKSKRHGRGFFTSAVTGSAPPPNFDRCACHDYDGHGGSRRRPRRCSPQAQRLPIAACLPLNPFTKSR